MSVRKKWLVRICIVILLGLVIGTLTAPPYNEELDSSVRQPNALAQQDDDVLVWVAMSGGGTRAAAMAWKVLEELSKVEIDVVRNGEVILSNLADEVDYISGISGGCFAAIAWPIYRENPEKFRELFLEKNIEFELKKGFVFPIWRPFAIISPRFDRSHIAAAYYHSKVFEKKTFADLPAKPVILVHATNLALGNRFTFSQDDFDKIGSDLSSYPLGYACAASSAFPVAFSPLTLRNYGQTLPVAQLRQEDSIFEGHERNSRNDVLDDLKRIARLHYNEKTNRYVHLSDGGIVDNQGLGAVLDQFDPPAGAISRRLADSTFPLRRLIIININAGVSPEEDLATRSVAPSIKTVVKHTMVASMDILSARRWMRIKDHTDNMYKSVLDNSNVPGLAKLEEPYTIEISFRNILDENLKEKCNQLPTSFKLEDEELRRIDSVVPALVSEDPDMQRLLASIATSRATK